MRLTGIDTDLAEFERLAQSCHIADLEAADMLYRGELLQDIDIASAPFEAWLAAERTRTLELAQSTLRRVAERLEPADPSKAIQFARQLIALDAFGEDAHRLLMRLYARTGRRAEAARQYQICTDMLREEFSLAPEPETQALARRIAQGEFSPLRTAPPPVAPDRAARARAGRPRWAMLLPQIRVGVAPLRNLTAGNRQERIVGAIADDIIADLVSGIRAISLCAIDSASDLAVRHNDIAYILTGSVQQVGRATHRLNVQILDALTREYLWVGRYEWNVDDFVAKRSGISRAISHGLHLLVIREASRSVAAPGTFSTSDCIDRARTLLEERNDAENVVGAQRWLLHAYSYDPRNVAILEALAHTCQLTVSQPWCYEPDAVAIAADVGIATAMAALARAPRLAAALRWKGMFASLEGRFEDAQAAFIETLALDPTRASAPAFIGYNNVFLGEPAAARSAISEAIRLESSDRRRQMWFFFAGFNELVAGQTDEAIAYFRRSLNLNPRYGSAALFSAAALALSGQTAAGKQQMALFREHYPEYRLSSFQQQWQTRSTVPSYRAAITPVVNAIRHLGLDS
ncbi:MAG TPA: BTAD domain-containing putative transcriptional regulator [Stellaceae bacterium]|nr:BTAD domain-containing putative transcriptional regulator [Stellaceae bacterium]